MSIHEGARDNDNLLYMETDLKHYIETGQPVLFL